MSEENLETFRRSLEAFDRRDKASWLKARDRDYEVMEGGADKVLVHQRNDVRGERGVNVEIDYWVVVSFRDGKMIRDQWFGSRDKALEAAGLSE